MVGLTLAICIFCAQLPGPSPSPRVPIKQTRETVRSRGKTIALDVLVPESAKPMAAVIVVHGNVGRGDEFIPGTIEEARRFAEAGYVAIVPHYFDRAKPDPKNGLKNAKSYTQWSQTIRDVVGYAAKRDDVDSGRIAIHGSSLGAWVALSAAGKDRRVRCVVEVYGGFPDGEGLNPANLPPTLILHGDDDKMVAVEEAYRLDELLTQARVEHEMHIYPGEGHGFRGEAREDSFRRTLAFFEERLKPDAAGTVVSSKAKRAAKKQ